MQRYGLPIIENRLTVRIGEVGKGLTLLVSEEEPGPGLQLYLPPKEEGNAAEVLTYRRGPVDRPHR
jgi:hypothetical protein